VRVQTSFSVPTSEVAVELSGKKYVIIKNTGAVTVNIAFGYKLTEKKSEGGYYGVPVGGTYKFEAPKGHLFYILFCYAASAGTIDISESDENLELIA